MERFVDFAVRLIRACVRAYARKWSFLGIFVAIFFCSVVVLGKLDFLPETSFVKDVQTLRTSSLIATSTNALAPTAFPELPMKIEIQAINLTAPIANPATTNVKDLDKELLKGVVRYPTSAKLGEIGNMVLFGHSSYLPVVHNQSYKTFNGIQKLSVGDEIIVHSSGMAYMYRVRSVAKEDANNASISLVVTGRVLTLATCDSFGAKTDRFIVTADFVESHLISTQ